MVRISSKVENLKSQLEMPVIELDSEVIGIIKNNVKNKKTRKNLVNQVNSILNYTKQIKHLKADIRSKIEFQPCNDFVFVQTFRKWIQKTEKVHLHAVNGVIHSADWTKIKKIRNDFNEKMDKVDALRTKYKSGIGIINQTLKSCTPDILNSIYITNIATKAAETITHLSKFVEILQNIRKILDEHNTERFYWADFIIGLRDMPTSCPRRTNHSKKKMSVSSFR